MSEQDDSWHNDLVFGFLGGILGMIVGMAASGHLRVSPSGALAVSIVCGAAFILSHFGDFPMRRFVQILASAVLAAILAGV
jgi:hypothetical protein